MITHVLETWHQLTGSKGPSDPSSCLGNGFLPTLTGAVFFPVGYMGWAFLSVSHASGNSCLDSVFQLCLL